MPYKFDFLDGDVLAWETGPDGASFTRDSDYSPTVYVGVRDGDRRKLDELQDELARDPKTTSVERERWFKDLRSNKRAPVLRVDLERIDEITTFAWEIRQQHEFDCYAPGTYQLYNVDFSEEFRYCLETGIDPTPGTELSLLKFSIEEKPLADRDVTELRMDGDPVAGAPGAVLERVAGAPGAVLERVAGAPGAVL